MRVLDKTHPNLVGPLQDCITGYALSNQFVDTGYERDWDNIGQFIGRQYVDRFTVLELARVLGFGVCDGTYCTCKCHGEDVVAAEGDDSSGDAADESGSADEPAAEVVGKRGGRGRTRN